MTAYEIVLIFIVILVLLMSFGSLIVPLLAYLNKRDCKRKNNAHPVATRTGTSH